MLIRFAVIIFFALWSFCFGFTIEIKLKNSSEIPLSCNVSLVRSYTDEHGNWWPNLGYVSNNGLVKQKPDIENFIKPFSESNWIKLPVHGRILVCRRISQKDVPWVLDVRITDGKNIISRSFAISEKRQEEYIYLYTVPVSPGPVKLEILLAEELVERNTEAVKQVAQEHPGKIPEKLAIYTDCKLTSKEPVEYREKQYKFLRLLGINGLHYAAAELIPEIINNGFMYLRYGGGTVNYDDYYKKQEEIEGKIKNFSLNASGMFERYNALKNVRNLKLGDEISSGLLQEYLAGGEKTRLEIIENLKNNKVPLSDIGVSGYEKIEIKPASIMRDENPGLFYWINRIRMERINRLWEIAKRANKNYFPYAWSSPNWPVSSYLGGGYDGHGWDLWHLYKNQYLDGIWGEDWPGYEVWLRGGNAFLVDMMRCQAKNLPMGIYNVVEWNYSPVYARYKFYEQLINGVTEIFWYSYGCLRGNEANPWEIKTDMVREIAMLNRDAGEAENYLLNTELDPASIAILWTPAQQIWEPEYNASLITLYYALLHANYSIDFVSGYDVEADCLKKYKLLYMPFNYVEKSVWEKIKKWVEDGGFLVIEGGFLKDHCNRDIDIGSWIDGFSSQRIERKNSTGRLPLELPQQQLLDVTQQVSFPVVCSKYVLSLPEGGSKILEYQDGGIAAIQVKKGKGYIRITGFYQGLSYIWDQENRDKSKWGDVLLYHGFSQELRNFVVAPAKDCRINRVCNIDQNLIIARKRTGKKYSCIAIFDYGFGKEKPVMPVWDDIGETTVKFETGPAKNIKCLHGKLLKDKNLCTVKFKGATMLLIER